jgi:hypothetical protein
MRYASNIGKETRRIILLIYFFAPIDEQVYKESEIKEIKAQLSKLKATKKRWQLAFGEGVMNLDEFRELSTMSKEQEQKLK